MTHVMQKRGHADCESILVVYARDVWVLVPTKHRPVARVAIKRPHHSLGRLDDASGVFKPIVSCSGIDEMRHSKLPNPSQAL
jgi:hypothetical protein